MDAGSDGGPIGRLRRSVAALAFAVSTCAALAWGGPAGFGGTSPAAAAESCATALPVVNAGAPLNRYLSNVDVSDDGRFVSYLLTQVPSDIANSIKSWVMRLDTETGETFRVDLRPDGGAPDDGTPSYFEPQAASPSMTPDGRFIAFESTSAQLVAGDQNGSTDVFVRDMTNGVTDIMSTLAGGGSSDIGGYAPTSTRSGAWISDDGDDILFATARRLVDGDLDSSSDLYVRHRETDEFDLVSVGSAGSPINASVHFGSLSAEGRYVVFGVPRDGTIVDFYRHDRDTGQTVEVSRNTAGGRGGTGEAVMSADGRFVAFSAPWALVDGDPTSGNRIYLRDMESDSIENVSSGSVPLGGPEVLTDDGSRVAFFVAGQPDETGATANAIVADARGESRVVLGDDGSPVHPTSLVFVDGTGDELLLARQTFNLTRPGGPFTVDLHLEHTLVDRAGIAELTAAGTDDPVEEILAGESVAVDVHGFNLTHETSFDLGEGLSLTDVDVSVDPPTATLVAEPDAAAGDRAVTAVAASGCATSGLSVRVLDGSPLVDDLSVDRMRPGQSADVTVTGRFLDCPCTIGASDGLVVGEIIAGSDTSMSVSLTAPDFDVDGYAGLAITNAAGKTTEVADAIALHTAMGELTPVTPARILDTRLGLGGPAEAIGSDARSVAIAGQGGVPAGAAASAVVMNVTVTNPSRGAHLTVWASGAEMPMVSNLNVVAGETRANQVTVPLGEDGSIDVSVSAGRAHVLFDVVGFYSSEAGPAGARFTPVPPKRLLDSRSMTTFRLAAGQTKTFGNGVPEVHPAAVFFPESARSAVLNVTVVNPSHAGWLTVAPVGQAAAGTSSINFVAGQTIANQVVVPVGDDSRIDLFNSHGTTDVIVDLVGYYGDDAKHDSDAAFRASGPNRFLDTRIGVGVDRSAPIAAGASLAFPVAGRLAVPAEAAAVVGNATVFAPEKGGYLTVWADDADSAPLSSTVNYLAGQIVPNAFTSLLGSGGELASFTSARTHVIVDIAGWFTAVDGRGGSAGSA